MCVNEPESDDGVMLVPDAAAPVVAVRLKVSDEAAGSVSVTCTPSTVVVPSGLCNRGQIVGHDDRRLVVPGDVRTVAAVRRDREARRVVVADQLKGAGTVVDLEMAGIGDADVGRRDARPGRSCRRS